MSTVTQTEIEDLIKQFQVATFDQHFARLKAGYEVLLPPLPQHFVDKPQEIGATQIDKLLQQFRSSTFSDCFTRLEQDYKSFLDQHPQRDPGFNIFQVLGIHGREVKTHSAFLRELLDPSGSHQEGFLFLKAFLEHCQSSLSNVIVDGQTVPHSFPDFTNKEVDAYDWLVSREYPTKRHGRLDILIRCEVLQFLCVIENKIHAYERMDQLKSYWEWLSVPDWEDKYPNRALIFLTPCGRESDYPAGVTYHPMSYKHDITNWLETTLPKTSPILRAIIEQYLATIGHIARCDGE